MAIRDHRRLFTVSALVALAVARPRLRNWGATVDDRSRMLPGDKLIPHERGVCTVAVDVEAPVVAVWPWLAQMTWWT